MLDEQVHRCGQAHNQSDTTERLVPMHKSINASIMDKTDKLCFSLIALSILGFTAYKILELARSCRHEWVTYETEPNVFETNKPMYTGVYLRCKKCGMVAFKKLQ